MTRSWWWFERPTPAVAALHRALARGCGGYLALAGVLSLAWSLSNDGSTIERTVSVTVTLCTLALAVVVWSGRRSLLVPIALLALTLVADLAGLRPPGQTSPVAVYLNLGVVLLLPTQLRAAPALVGGVVSSAALVLVSPDVVASADVQVLTLGALIAEIGFLRLLFASAHELDRVSEQTHEQVVSRAAAEVERSTIAEARSILHDDVMGSLMLLRHGDPDDAVVREHAARGLAALRRAGLAP